METKTQNKYENFSYLKDSNIIVLYINLCQLPKGRRRQENYWL